MPSVNLIKNEAYMKQYNLQNGLTDSKYDGEDDDDDDDQDDEDNDIDMDNEDENDLEKNPSYLAVLASIAKSHS